MTRAEVQACLRPSKYGNRKTTVNGIKFDSKREAQRWSELKLAERSGYIRDVQRQVPFRCEHNGKLLFTYRADFVYYEKNGVRVVEDVKGFRTAIYRLKKKILKIMIGIEIREVK